MTEPHITQQELKELFDYCDKTGNLIWKTKPNKNGGKAIIGQPTGTIVTNPKSGYQRKVSNIKGKMYKTHRLVWLWHYGTLPKTIDHKDNNPLNNKIENLRECTISQNNSNRKFIGNKSGYKGVSRIEKNNSIYYKAQITINNKNKNLGSFKTPEEAHEAYKKAAIERHKEFYKFN
jgi:hypothetical protein